ncbi:hypothetical protein HDU84_005382 [Entophlyctis sp. JEL0112]|nr:hypothetical protein HDU84_005382 [Entophlyctis sp. JEL0112]
MTATAAVAAAHGYCLNAVRTGDWEGFVATLFIPARARSTVLAIRALNIEAAGVTSSSASSPVAASMRFKFWTDLIEGVYAGTPVNHPIAVALADALSQPSAPPLSKQFMLRLISARQENHLRAAASNTAAPISTRSSLLPTQSRFETVSALETHAERANASMLYLQLEACGVRDFAVDRVASDIGKSLGIISALRAIPADFAASMPLSVPAEILQRHANGTLPSTSFAEGKQQMHMLTAADPRRRAMSDAVFDLATVANNRMATALAEIRELVANTETGAQTRAGGAAGSLFSPHGAANAGLMPAIAGRLFLRRLEAVDFDVFDRRLSRRDWRLLYELWRTNRRGSLVD